MIEPVGTVIDADLNAYVDDQLDTGRRIEVEHYLSLHPDEAARVMAELRTRDELRLALAGTSGVPNPGTSEAARRLERGLLQSRVVSGLQRVAAVATFVALGWLAHANFGPLFISQVVASVPPPAYVDDAVMAHRTSLVRASMSSQPEVLEYNPGEIRAATGITMPALPANWHVLDVQLFPSKFGPSVEVAIRTLDFGLLSLFAVRPGTFDVVKPEAVRINDATAAYFQIGDVAYALVTKSGSRELDQAASRLAKTLY